MTKRFTIFAAVLGMALALVSCKFDHTKTKIQYMPDMADSPTVKTQEDYLEAPENSVPTNAILYPATPEEAEKLLKNPYQASTEVMDKGKVLYETYCVVCHGLDAKGHGYINQKDGVDDAVFPPPPDLTLETYVKRADGFYFYRITHGSAIMPPYGHATSPHERWQIVHYLRSLQQKGG